MLVVERQWMKMRTLSAKMAMASLSTPPSPFDGAGYGNPGRLVLDQPPHDGLQELLHLCRRQCRLGLWPLPLCGQLQLLGL